MSHIFQIDFTCTDVLSGMSAPQFSRTQNAQVRWCASAIDIPVKSLEADCNVGSKSTREVMVRNLSELPLTLRLQLPSSTVRLTGVHSRSVLNSLPPGAHEGDTFRQTAYHLSPPGLRLMRFAGPSSKKVSKWVLTVPPRDNCFVSVEFSPTRADPHYSTTLLMENLCATGEEISLAVTANFMDIHNIVLHGLYYRMTFQGKIPAKKLASGGSSRDTTNLITFDEVVHNNPSVRKMYVQNLTESPLTLSLSTGMSCDELYFFDERDIHMHAVSTSLHSSLPSRLEAEGLFAASEMHSTRDASHGSTVAAGVGSESTPETMPGIEEGQEVVTTSDHRPSSPNPRVSGSAAAKERLLETLDGRLKRDLMPSMVELDQGDDLEDVNDASLSSGALGGNPLARRTFSSASLSSGLLDSGDNVLRKSSWKIDGDRSSRGSWEMPLSVSLEGSLGEHTTALQNAGFSDESNIDSRRRSAEHASSAERQDDLSRSGGPSREFSYPHSAPPKDRDLFHSVDFGKIQNLSSSWLHALGGLSSTSLTEAIAWLVTRGSLRDVRTAGYLDSNVRRQAAALSDNGSAAVIEAFTGLERDEGGIIRQLVDWRNDVRDLLRVTRAEPKQSLSELFVISKEGAMSDGGGKAKANTVLRLGPGEETAVYLVVVIDSGFEKEKEKDVSKRGQFRRRTTHMFVNLVEYNRDVAKEVNDGKLLSQEANLRREIPMRLLFCASLLDVTQHHVNFGTLTVGDHRARNLIVRNLSDVPLAYKVRKSGSISSGDIHIIEGKSGFVAPRSIRNLTYIYQPSLALPLDEKVEIVNLQDDSQSVFVHMRAVVLKSVKIQVSAPKHLFAGPFVMAHTDDAEAMALPHSIDFIGFNATEGISQQIVVSNVNNVGREVQIHFDQLASKVARGKGGSAETCTALYPDGLHCRFTVYSQGSSGLGGTSVWTGATTATALMKGEGADGDTGVGVQERLEHLRRKVQGYERKQKREKLAEALKEISELEEVLEAEREAHFALMNDGAIANPSGAEDAQSSPGELILATGVDDAKFYLKPGASHIVNVQMIWTSNEAANDGRVLDAQNVRGTVSFYDSKDADNRHRIRLGGVLFKSFAALVAFTLGVNKSKMRSKKKDKGVTRTLSSTFTSTVNSPAPGSTPEPGVPPLSLDFAKGISAHCAQRELGEHFLGSPVHVSVALSNSSKCTFRIEARAPQGGRWISKLTGSADLGASENRAPMLVEFFPTRRGKSSISIDIWAQLVPFESAVSAEAVLNSEQDYKSSWNIVDTLDVVVEVVEPKCLNLFDTTQGSARTDGGASAEELSLGNCALSSGDEYGFIKIAPFRLECIYSQGAIVVDISCNLSKQIVLCADPKDPFAGTSSALRSSISLIMSKSDDASGEDVKSGSTPAENSVIYVCLRPSLEGTSFAHGDVRKILGGMKIIVRQACESGLVLSERIIHVTATMHCAALSASHFFVTLGTVFAAQLEAPLDHGVDHLVPVLLFATPGMPVECSAEVLHPERGNRPRLCRCRISGAIEHVCQSLSVSDLPRVVGGWSGVQANLPYSVRACRIGLIEEEILVRNLSNYRLPPLRIAFRLFVDKELLELLCARHFHSVVDLMDKDLGVFFQKDRALYFPGPDQAVDIPAPSRLPVLNLGFVYCRSKLDGGRVGRAWDENDQVNAVEFEVRNKSSSSLCLQPVSNLPLWVTLTTEGGDAFPEGSDKGRGKKDFSCIGDPAHFLQRVGVDDSLGVLDSLAPYARPGPGAMLQAQCPKLACCGQRDVPQNGNQMRLDEWVVSPVAAMLKRVDSAARNHADFSAGTSASACFETSEMSQYVACGHPIILSPGSKAHVYVECGVPDNFPFRQATALAMGDSVPFRGTLLFSEQAQVATGINPNLTPPAIGYTGHVLKCIDVAGSFCISYLEVTGCLRSSEENLRVPVRNVLDALPSPNTDLNIGEIGYENGWATVKCHLQVSNASGVPANFSVVHDGPTELVRVLTDASCCSIAPRESTWVDIEIDPNSFASSDMAEGILKVQFVIQNHANRDNSPIVVLHMDLTRSPFIFDRIVKEPEVLSLLDASTSYMLPHITDPHDRGVIQLPMLSVPWPEMPCGDFFSVRYRPRAEATGDPSSKSERKGSSRLTFEVVTNARLDGCLRLALYSRASLAPLSEVSLVVGEVHEMRLRLIRDVRLENELENVMAACSIPWIDLDDVAPPGFQHCLLGCIRVHSTRGIIQEIIVIGLLGRGPSFSIADKACDLVPGPFESLPFSDGSEQRQVLISSFTVQSLYRLRSLQIVATSTLPRIEIDGDDEDARQLSLPTPVEPQGERIVNIRIAAESREWELSHSGTIHVYDVSTGQVTEVAVEVRFPPPTTAVDAEVLRDTSVGAGSRVEREEASPSPPAVMYGEGVPARRTLSSFLPLGLPLGPLADGSMSVSWLPKLRITGCHAEPGGIFLLNFEHLDLSTTPAHRTFHLELEAPLIPAHWRGGCGFRIYPIKSSDEKWLSLSCNNGLLRHADEPFEEGNASATRQSITVQCVPSEMGIWSTYLVIENLANPTDMNYIRVSLLVTAEMMRNVPAGGGSGVRGKDGSFFHLTVGERWSGSERGGEVENPHVPTINMRHINYGRAYRNRSFVIVNTSSTSMEFVCNVRLDSRHDNSATEFSLSLSNDYIRRFTSVQLGAGDKRRIWCHICPELPEGGIPHEQESLVLTATVTVFSRSVKNQHRTLKLHATCFVPCVSLSHKDFVWRRDTNSTDGYHFDPPSHELTLSSMMPGMDKVITVRNETSFFHVEFVPSSVSGSWTESSLRLLSTPVRPVADSDGLSALPELHLTTGDEVEGGAGFGWQLCSAGDAEEADDSGGIGDGAAPTVLTIKITLNMDQVRTHWDDILRERCVEEHLSLYAHTGAKAAQASFLVPLRLTVGSPRHFFAVSEARSLHPFRCAEQNCMRFTRNFSALSVACLVRVQGTGAFPAGVDDDPLYQQLYDDLVHLTDQLVHAGLHHASWYFSLACLLYGPMHGSVLFTFLLSVVEQADVNSSVQGGGGLALAHTSQLRADALRFLARWGTQVSHFLSFFPDAEGRDETADYLLALALRVTRCLPLTNAPP